ncbi:hypothetical protein [Pseudonocardia xishanensis]|uniref:Uncharacterized protein n=1 Tax=Pseudonocardia xishanensis TaxID=630995 RepID=A0ABP8S2C2_9PSEU
MSDRFAEVAAVADTVLFEGYLLYPYRASAQKNRVRWQWGVLVPAGFGADSGETSANRTEVLLEPGPDCLLHLRLRFLQLDRGSGPDGQPYDGGVPREVDATLALADLPAEIPVELPGDGERQLPLHAVLAVSATAPPGPYDVVRLRVDVRNTAPSRAATRDDALRQSLIGTHLMLAVEPGSFVSPTDPPEWAAPDVAECRSAHLWPASAGAEDRSDLLLSAPIILGDHARIAPESPVDLFDGTENDEILTLRTMVLTDAEKAEARARDPRAAALVDAVDALPPEILERLHGAVRSLRPVQEVPTLHTPPETPWWDPAADASVDPDTDSVLVGRVPVARGSAVVLRPGPGTDAQDTFLTGRRATVEAVVHDVDGGVHVAVSVPDDPASALSHGRFRYFRPDELEVP